MPEVQEVFRMATQKIRPEPDFLEKQHLNQRRRMRSRKIAAIGLVTVIGLLVGIVLLESRPSKVAIMPADTSPALSLPDPHAIEVSIGFIDAFGAFDPERAASYLAENAYLEMDASTPERLPIFLSLLEAMGYEQIRRGPCQVEGVGEASASGTEVSCPFEWHAIRSNELGLGPYPGRWDLVILDGEIVSVSLHWFFAKEFSPQVWEPFSEWVSQNHPKDFDVMFIPGGGNFRLSEESVQLWEKRTKEYVEAVMQGAA